jgi:hypothetical protein
VESGAPTEAAEAERRCQHHQLRTIG